MQEQVAPPFFRLKSKGLKKVKAAAFLTRLHFRTSAVQEGSDPLAEARDFLKNNAETGEGRALRKVIATLATADGDFYRDRCLVIQPGYVQARFRIG